MASMEEWLRQQAERAQARIVSAKSAMVITPTIYFAAQRLTSSDVLSIVTTTVAEGPSLPDETEAKAAKGRLRDTQYVSPLRNPVSLKAEEHQRRNRALWREADLFLSNLASRRQARAELETAAATKIQCLFRGWKWRKFIEAEKKKREVRSRLKNRIKFLNRSMGVVIEERERKERILADQRRAVVRIQSMVRAFFARRAALKERYMVQVEVLQATVIRVQGAARKRLGRRAGRNLKLLRKFQRDTAAARKIQRTVRGFFGRQHARARKFAVLWVAAHMIERAYVCYKARVAKAKEKARRAHELHNKGAIGVQRLIRGKRARRWVQQLRDQENNLLREAAALVIQRVFRGSLGRRIAKHRLWRLGQEDRLAAALFIGRVWRGALGRMAYQDEVDRQATDVFDQARLGNDEKVKDLMAGFGTDKVYHVASIDSKGNTVLLVAARWGHKKIVKHCLRLGMQIDHMNFAGKTAVELAVQYEREEVADWLISKGCDLRLYGRTLLHEAAKRGMLSTAKALLAVNVPIMACEDDGITALHEAAAANQDQMLITLVERGGDVNFADTRGWTPLHSAAAAGASNAVIALLSLGADVSIADYDNRTAWRIALANEHEDCARILRDSWRKVAGAAELDAQAAMVSDADQAAAFSAAMHNKRGILEQLLDQGVPLTIKNDGDSTLLHVAAATGSESVVELLLSRGANPKVVNFQGFTPLHLAVRHERVCAKLLAAGAEAGAVDSNGRTPFHEAAALGWVMDSALSKELLDVNVADHEGRTALHLAALGAQATACDKLLTLGARVNLPDAYGQTALLIACGVARGTATVKVLLSRGAAVNHSDKQGSAPIHVAINAKQADVVLMLLEAGANLAQLDGTGMTPAHLAILTGQGALVTPILQYGGNPRATNRAGVSLLRFAVEHDCAPAVQTINAHGVDVVEEYDDGSTPLHIAARCGSMAAASTLMQIGGSKLVQKRDSLGDTPVMSGIRHGCATVLPMLVRAGDKLAADSLHVAASAPQPGALKHLLDTPALGFTKVNAVNELGLSPLHCAAVENRVRNCRLLIAAGADDTIVDTTGSTPAAAARLVGCVQAETYLMTKHEPQGEEP